MNAQNACKSVITTNHTHIQAVVGKPYFVQCGRYRCVAYVDSEGHWRSYYGNHALVEGPVKVDREFGSQ